MDESKFLTIKQKIVAFIVMLIAYINPYTLETSFAKIWWDEILDGNSGVSGAGSVFNGMHSGIQKPIKAALQVAAPICKVYCFYFFPLMFVLNLILMALSKDDKAMGACKTAIITEITVLFLMILFPSLLWEGIKATGANTAN